jgi:hypothetical protein
LEPDLDTSLAMQGIRTIHVATPTNMLQLQLLDLQSKWMMGQEKLQEPNTISVKY